jgi:hypothetical protein
MTHGPAMTMNVLPADSCFHVFATDSGTREFYWSADGKQSFVLLFAARKCPASRYGTVTLRETLQSTCG